MTDKATEPSESLWNPRSRPIVSCLNCRRKKQKCDRRSPCNSCIRSGRPESCEYAPGIEPISGSGDDEPQSSKRRRIDSDDRSDVDSQVTVASFNELRDRVNQLEGALEAQKRQIQSLLNPSANVGELSNSIEHYNPWKDEFKKISELSLYKPLRVQFPDLQSFIDKLSENELSEELYAVASDLRILSRLFEKPKMRDGNFHIYGSIDHVLAHMERLLPSENDCRVLIDLYFQTFENSLRVLHPIARTQFRAFFRGQLIQGQRMTCLPTLLAVVSMGSSLGTCLECDNPLLHGQHDGIGAYQLIRNYLALLSEKQWGELSNLQIAVLSLKGHKSSSCSPVQNWQWSGEVVRRAMAAGIHHLSSDGRGVYDQEIKRRLWLTILELDLTLSVASNMPATCPSWDHEAPLSINDNKLYPLMESLPPTEGLDQWTDGICQHVLAHSFNDRRKAYALVSTGKPASCQTVLRHTRHLEQVMYDLPEVFSLSSMTNQESDSPYRLIAKMEVDFLLRRPLNACYATYGAEPSPDDAFKDARIPWIQGCSFSACFQDLFDPKYPTLDLPSPEGLWDFYYNGYDWDVHRYFLSNCLELQRLRLLDKDAADVASQPFQGHTLREPVKIMGWNIEGITKSVEDVIDPLTRRLGRHPSDFGDVVRWVAIIGALRVSPSCSRQHAIKNELQGLVSDLYNRHGHPTGSSRMSSSGGRPRATDISDIEWLKTILSGDEVETKVSH